MTPPLSKTEEDDNSYVMPLKQLSAEIGLKSRLTTLVSSRVKSTTLVFELQS